MFKQFENQPSFLDYKVVTFDTLNMYANKTNVLYLGTDFDIKNNNDIYVLFQTLDIVPELLCVKLK